MIRKHGWVFIAAVVWVASGPPIGTTARADDVQVNTYTTNSQARPSVALNADGDFVVVWQSLGSAGTDTSGYSIQAQRYAADGSAVGGEFQVNTFTTNNQSRPSAAVGANGDFVVVWDGSGSSGTDSSSYSIQAQRYASDGSAVGGEFQVNTFTTSFQFAASVGLEASGGFVVVWQSDGSGGSDLSGSSIQAQRYASDGSTVGGELQVNTYTTSSQFAPSMALGATGDWVVVWTSNGSGGTDSSYGSVQAQRYASDGFPAGGQFQVNAYTSGMQYGASMGLEADGDFVVIWHSEGSGGTDSLALSVQGQRYASDGSPAGSQFQVNTYTTNSQHYPTVALAADGDFVAMWHSLGSSGTDSSFQSIQRQRYASDGSVVGGEFQVNTYTSNRQEYASVAIDGTGNVVVVWDSEGSGGTDSSGRSIQKTLGGLIFADGFESGDTSSWSATVGGG